jgi:hypothetical protein
MTVSPPIVLFSRSQKTEMRSWPASPIGVKEKVVGMPTASNADMALRRFKSSLVQKTRYCNMSIICWSMEGVISVV